MTALEFTPSPQQAALFDFIDNGTGSAFLEAFAGTGKTTTLIQACRRLRGGVVFVAFNKKIVEEIKNRLADLGLYKNIEAATFHSLGFKAVRKVYPKTRVDGFAKRDRIIRDIGIPEPLHAFVFALVGHAKNRAIDEANIHNVALWWEIIDHFDLLENIADATDAERGIEFAQKALEHSIAISADLIDFDDMIYLPVIKGMRVWQFDWVLVDEAQDTNEARRSLARMVLKQGGRSLWVGDRYQSIYGFTGADADAVTRIIKEFNCKLLPLTVTYRCPKTVVKLANTIVPQIEAHASAPDGTVKTIKHDEFIALPFKDSDAILCRKTAPLVELAFQLIRKNIACHVEGRDIGQGLLKLATRWKIKSVPALLQKLEEYREREVAKLVAKGRETQAGALADRVDTLVVLAEGCDTVDCIKQKIENLFQDTEGKAKTTLTLVTIHRSKGREWHSVYLFGYNQFQPSKWARQEWEMIQEKNLQYVAITRAKTELTIVDVA